MSNDWTLRERLPFIWSLGESFFILQFKNRSKSISSWEDEMRMRNECEKYKTDFVGAPGQDGVRSAAVILFLGRKRSSVGGLRMLLSVWEKS